MAPGSIPASGKPTFEIAENEIGLGMGIHGEPGVKEIPMTTADELTPMMLDLVFEDFEKDEEVAELSAGDEIVLLVNSLGATTMMECLICLRKAKEILNARGIVVRDTIGRAIGDLPGDGGNFFLGAPPLDDELRTLWDNALRVGVLFEMQS